MNDLWLDKYQKTRKKPPGSFLNEQALKLGQKTNHQVEPKVSSSKVLYQYNDTLWYKLLLSIPTLPHYRRGHLTMMHGADFYPVLFLIDEEIKQELRPELEEHNRLLTVESEEEFRDVLQGIFKSKETERIVNSLRARNGQKEVSA